MPRLRKPNIVHLGIDSLKATHMSCYGYKRLTTPHMDRFATGGTLFERTYSPNIPTTSGYVTGTDCYHVVCVPRSNPARDPQDFG